MLSGTLVMDKQKEDMETKRRICLYGNSMILGTIGASLRRLPQYEVISLPAKISDLKDVVADAVLFDLEATHLETAFSWLTYHPDLLIIGISPDTNIVRMWSGKQLRELSTNELSQIIKEQLR